MPRQGAGLKVFPDMTIEEISEPGCNLGARCFLRWLSDISVTWKLDAIK